MRKAIFLMSLVLVLFCISVCAIAENIQIKEGTNPHVRTLPSTDGKIIGFAKSGQVYEVLSVSENNWYQIQLDHENVGWIAGGMAESVSLQNASAFESNSSDEIIKAQKIKFNENTIYLAVGYTTKAGYTITPENANEVLLWKSSDTRIATVDENGNITGVKNGFCKICIYTDNGKKLKAQVTVTVDQYDMVFVSQEPQTGYDSYPSGGYTITGKVKTGCVQIPDISASMTAETDGKKPSCPLEIYPIKPGKDVVTVSAGSTKTAIKVLVLPEAFASKIQDFGFGYGAILEKDLEGVFNGHTYRIVTDNVEWDAAKKACEEQGGHLITITSAGEQQFIESLLSSNKRPWLGLRRNEADPDNWSWVTGETFSYSNWENGEPNNYGGSENCAVLSAGYRWNDLSRTNLKQSSGYICEWDFILDEIDLAGDFPPVHENPSIDEKHSVDETAAAEKIPADASVSFDESEEIKLLAFSSVSNTASAKVVHENGVYKLTTLKNKNPGTDSNSICFKLASAFDATSYSVLVFYIKDLQGTNTHKVTLADDQGQIHSQWIDIKSDYEQWKRIDVQLSDYQDIDLRSIVEIRIGEWNKGQYWFDRIGFMH